MKLLRRIMVAAFALAVCVFAVFYIMDMREDKTIPVLKVESEILDISLEAGEEEMLQGVKRAAVTSGSSTPSVLTEQLIRTLQAYADTGVLTLPASTPEKVF